MYFSSRKAWRPSFALGAAAIPAIPPLLEDGEAGRRIQVMCVLAKIAEPGTTEAFQHRLEDRDKRVRAYAAVGLARIEHLDALTWLEAA